jgi:hypothetical protein
LASIATRRGNADRNLPALARATFLAAVSPPGRIKASFGRHLAGDGRAGDARHRRRAAGDPPHLPCPRRHQQGADRTGEDDAWPLSWGRGAAWSDHGGCWSPRASKTRSRPCRRPDKRHGPHSRLPGCARSNCRWRLAMSLSLPMATSPGRRQRTTRRGAGNEEGGAFASPVHRVGLISTTCFWAAPSATRRDTGPKAAAADRGLQP